MIRRPRLCRGDALANDMIQVENGAVPLAGRTGPMISRGSDIAFSGSIPQFYERHLVPLIFAPYAADIAARAQQQAPSRVLEVAAGSGAATRALAKALLSSVSIVATDLNQPMLDHAAAIGTSRPVQWQQADAMQLPFADESFDLVVCQFGAMFFPDKAQAFAEARRVLRPGGSFLFSVWDSIKHNEFADVVVDELARLFTDDPPRFLARIPHGYHDRTTIEADLAAAGFADAPEFSTVTECSRAPSARIPAMAYCQGTPLRSEIESRDASRLEEATALATAALERRFGTANLSGKIQAHVVSAVRKAETGTE
jgi:SAM-dependent methyltransferase